MAFRGNNDSRLTSDPTTVSSRIFIGNLFIKDLNKTQLTDKFSKYGVIKACSLNRGFAFVQFELDSSASEAIQQENGTIYLGKKIEVKPARIPNRPGGMPGGMPGAGDVGRNADNGRPEVIRDRSPLDDRRDWRDRERFEGGFPGSGGPPMDRGAGDRPWPKDHGPIDIVDREMEIDRVVGDKERGPMDRGRAPMDVDKERGPLDRDSGPMDRGRMDRERGPMDRGPMDRGDRGPMDRGPMDRRPMDRERGPMDRGIMDRERVPMDRGPMDRGPMDRGPMDRGPMDRGPMDRGPMDRGPMDRERGPMDRGPLDRERGPMDRGPMDRERGPMDRGPMDRERGPMDRGPMDRERGPMDRGPMDRGPMDRGPMDRERGPMDRGPMDRERGPMDRGPMDRERGLMDRGPMDRDRGPLDRERGPMDRGPMDYDSMDRGGFYSGDRNGKFPSSDNFRGVPPGFRPGMGGDPPRAGPHDYGSGSPVINIATADRTNDCEIIVVNKSNREYAEYIERRLKQLGLTVDLLFPNEVVPIPRVLANISSRGSLYAIVVLQQNEEHRSLTLNILHGLPEEHRNMPMEAAVSLISRNFEVYIRGEKSGAPSVPGAVSVGGALPTQERHPEPIQALLTLLSDNRQLTVLQYDKVLHYLETRRQTQLKVELGDVKEIIPPRSSGTQQVELQHRILTILNSSATPTPIAPVAAPVPAWQSDKGVPPLLNDPTVQKALDSLIQGDLLRKISGPGNPHSKMGRF